MEKSSKSNPFFFMTGNNTSPKVLFGLAFMPTDLPLGKSNLK